MSFLGHVALYLGR